MAVTAKKVRNRLNSTFLLALQSTLSLLIIFDPRFYIYYSIDRYVWLWYTYLYTSSRINLLITESIDLFRNLQQQKISFSLPLNPPPPAFGASATPTVENLLQNPPPESTAMAAAASDSISSQFSLLSSGPNLDRTSDSNLDPTSNASNKPILLNPGDFLAAGGGALDSAPPPAPLGDSSSVWTEREQSFGRAAEPVLFIGGAAQTESLDVSGSLAFGRLDSSAPNTPEQPAIGPLVSQAQSSEAVGAPIGFRSTAPGVGSAFHPYSSPGRRSNDAVLSSLVPVSLPPVSTSVPHASFMSLPQTAVSALKPRLISLPPAIWSSCSPSLPNWRRHCCPIRVLPRSSSRSPLLHLQQRALPVFLLLPQLAFHRRHPRAARCQEGR